MSMRSYFVYGYGFDVDSVDFGTTLKFIYNHASTLLQLYNNKAQETLDKITADIKANWSDENNDIDDEAIDNYFDDIMDPDDVSDDIYDALGNITENEPEDIRMFDTVAQIMTRETGITINYEQGQPDECVGDPALIFPMCYPWECNEKEKNLTEDDLNDILTPYINEFGLESKPMSLEIEYYG